MVEYISREAAENLFYTVDPENDGSDGGTIILMPGTYNSAEIEEMLDNLPAADVEPVRHGRWLKCFEDWRQQIEGSKCSACGFEYYGTNIIRFRYCPNCGAKMGMGRGGENASKEM